MPPWIGPGRTMATCTTVVMLARPQPGHAHLRARLDLEHADGVGVAESCRRSDRRLVGCPAAAAARSRRWPASSSDAAQRRQTCSASTSTFAAGASRSSLSPLPLRSGMAAFSIRHQARDHEAARVLRQVARKAHQRLRQPGPLPRTRESGPARRRPACAAFPSCRPTTGARAPPRRSRRCPRQARGRCRAARCAVDRDDHRGQRSGRGHTCRRCTGSLPRGAGARSPRRSGGSLRLADEALEQRGRVSGRPR